MIEDTPPIFAPDQPDLIEPETFADDAPSAVESVKKAVHRAGEVYDRARQPGMPLSILSNIAREAPLGSLLAAFLLGVAFARRR